ncbi:hypothetical protein N0V84_008591 [Fusarium piperis]|uniref:Uncharacterized protein n=1 Tax=Fusarium piperis TaxID=1435070 RepID=A0A9W8W7U9_9HYPO|nr:hypothetical protein N0V84_008591 [Fusarium piperis]
MASPPRRSPKPRAAAPTTFADPGSDDDSYSEPSRRASVPKDASAPRVATSPASLAQSSSSDGVPLIVRKRAKAVEAATARPAADKDQDTEYENSNSNSPIPAVSPKTAARPAEKASPAGKRVAPMEHTDSPAKKPRIVLKKNNRYSDGAIMPSSPMSPVEAASPSKEATPATSLAHSQPPINQETETVPHETRALIPAALHPAEAAGFQQINDFLVHIRDSADAAQKKVQGLLDAREMQAKITALETQLAALNAQGAVGDLSECQKALNDSLAREKQLSARCESLQVECQKQKAYSTELRQDVGELTDELEKYSDFPYEKVTDDEIGHEWLRLAHEIQNFALQVLTRDPTRVGAPPGANIPQVTALRAKRKQDPELVNFHFQKHVWDRINSEVFQAGSNLWGGRSGKAFNRLCIDVTGGDADEMKNLSPMKAQTAKILRSTHDEVNEAQVAKLVNGLKLDLHVFTDPEMTKDSEKSRFVERRLKKIIDRAMRLNLVFMTSRAFFLPMAVQNDYEDQDVDIRYTRGNPEEETELEIQVSPQVVKFGDADGYNFDSCIIVCKSIVTMCEVKPRGGKRGRE